MFFGQLLKILFFAALLYLSYNLVAYIMRIRRLLKDRRRQEEEKFRNTHRSPSEENGKEVIELDKNHYKVE